MKNLAILFITLLFINPLHAQRWSSAFVGKPESRALYASNVAKAIQNAWENELLSKDKKEMLLDEIIFGQDSEPKQVKTDENVKPIMSNIDEIEEVLGIKEEVKNDPVKKKKVEIPMQDIPVKTASPIKEENVTTMGNVDEVKEALESVKIQPSNGEYSTNKKTPLTINNDDAEADSVYSIPQVSPIFPGGQNAMRSFFAKNIITPESDGKSVKGKVFVRFVVKKNGELSKIYLVKGLNDACNKEAIRVIKKMPSWIPATQEGDAVSSWHTLPIYFEIE
jgi:periplasmic protein TonB